MGKPFAQNDSIKRFVADSLEPVIVEAFSNQVKWKEAAASIAQIDQKQFLSFAPLSLVPSFNTISGLRMEERSPGSYRLSIRGSLLRSPFGVRNVKIYWNGLPISDATGNAYLNLVDLQQISSAEVIKGPAASVYGAGTGGVVLLKSNLPFAEKKQQEFSAAIQSGSHGLLEQDIVWKYQNKNFSSALRETYLKSDGYREQSALHKTNLQYEAALLAKQHQLQLLSWYTDIAYQTPGGITLAQMQLNPRLARQPSSSLPGAVQQQTAIYNKTFFVGIEDKWTLGKGSMLRSFASLNNTRFENPFITNYEFRNETNTGIGVQWIYQPNQNSIQWISGLEWLYNHSVITDFGNRKGVRDTLQFSDNIFTNQWTGYTQLQKIFAHRWQLNAGISFNQQLLSYQRTSDPLANRQLKSTAIVPAPRFSVLYNLNKNIAAYSIIAFGFSPPSLAEVRPSDGNYYGNLAPEKGWNFEMGLKGFLLQNKLQLDIAYYHFKLNDAIVKRTNSGGAEYFINAGTALQQGFELSGKLQAIRNSQHIVSSLFVWTSFSYQPYHFINYQQGNSSFAGNALTGVPKKILALGIDLGIFKKFILHSNLNAVSTIPLTDANDAYADPYQLVQLKLDYLYRDTRHHILFFAGIDNLLNQRYSLGNDINAAGKRFYNPASERNFFAGLRFKLIK